MLLITSPCQNSGNYAVHSHRTNILTFPLHLQITQLVNVPVEGGGGGGQSWGRPVYCPPRTKDSHPPALQQRIAEWRRAPPHQYPQGLPVAATILTLDLLANPEAISRHQRLIVEVGVGTIFWAPGPLVLWLLIHPCW